MNSLPERMGIHLPQYQTIKMYEGFGEIKIMPYPFWRRIWIFGKTIPYFVGQNIVFTLKIKNWEHSTFRQPPLYVFETFGTQPPKVNELNQLKPELRGNTIDHECDVVYKIAKLPSGANSITVFTARVMNWDRWLPAFLALIVGAILAVPCGILGGILLGFIQVTPSWRIWLP